MWADETHFSLHDVVNIQNSRIWATPNNREYHSQPLHSAHVTVWCGFTASFNLGPFFLNNLLLNPTEKLAQSLQKDILHFYATTLSLNSWKEMCYLLSPS